MLLARKTILSSAPIACRIHAEVLGMRSDGIEPLPVEVRKYRAEDVTELCTLFYETVHTVNARDYTPEQLSAWAPRNADLVRWNNSLLAHNAFVATHRGHLVGFGDMAQDGYLDRLYVHKDYQGRGIATALCNVLESCVTAARLTVHASLTARGFFEGRGYSVVTQRRVLVRGVWLSNFLMEKIRRVAP